MIYNELALFVSVARLNSFSAAAEELAIPLSRVSRKIAALEAHLGMKLFERTTRQVRLTEEGRLLLDRCQAPLEMLQDIGTTSAVSDVQTIRLTASSLAARVSIAGPLLSFLEAYPDVRVELTSTNSNLDFVRDNIDVAFRLGPLDDSNLITRRLWDVPYVFSASASFLAKYQLNSQIPADRFMSLPAIVTRVGWRLQNGKRIKPSNPVHVLDDLELVQRFAQQGLGVVLLPADMVTGDLQVLNVTGMVPETRIMYLVYPDRRLLPQRVRRLITHFVNQSTPTP